MKCFIVMDNPDNKIIKVQENDIVAFREEYGAQILIEGSSVQDVLMQLSERMQTSSDSLPRELSQ